MAVLEKKALSFEELEAQTALELPERESPVLVVLTCLVCVGRVNIPINIEDVNVAAQVCAAVDAIQVNVLSVPTDAFACEIRQQ
jgi:hypothetical protein